MTPSKNVQNKTCKVALHVPLALCHLLRQKLPRQHLLPALQKRIMESCVTAYKVEAPLHCYGSRISAHYVGRRLPVNLK